MEINVNNIFKYAASNDSAILLEIDSLIGNLDTLLKNEGLYLFNILINCGGNYEKKTWNCNIE
jgi:hypothetical protein